MHAPYRERPQKPKWFDDPWTVFGVIVSAILSACALIWFAVEVRTRYELQAAAEAIQATTATWARESAEMTRRSKIAALQAAAARERIRLSTPVTTTVRVAPQDREACLQETGGVANEHYVRCRNGYSYQGKALPSR
ncbi:MAG TPA: hypothetical protein VLI06_17820 [Solimonas sp.]|nr:hypothetical protein [Solimonas sp.]